MGYIKAEEILPKELIEEIQNHIEGKSIYIPKREGTRQDWGTSTLTRRELEERNRAICQEFSQGSKVVSWQQSIVCQKKAYREYYERGKRI